MTTSVKRSPTVTGTVDSPEIAMAKAIRDAVLDQVPSLISKSLDPQLKGIQNDLMVLVGGIVRKELDKEVAGLKQLCNDLTSRLERKSVELVEAVKMAMRELAPSVTVEAPTVNVPAGAIQVSLKELPIPIVNVPENAIAVNMSPSVVNVPAEAIQVSFKELPKKVEKSIIYGQSGRPEKIVETTMEG